MTWSCSTRASSASRQQKRVRWTRSTACCSSTRGWRSVTWATSSGKVKIENIPPEEFLIQRSAKSIEDADFVAHKVLKTRSDLIQMGFDRDIVDDLPTQNTVTMNDERLARFADIDESSINDAPDESTEDIEIYECYVKYNARSKSS